MKTLFESRITKKASLLFVMTFLVLCCVNAQNKVYPNVTGQGTSSIIPKWSSSSVILESNITDLAGNIGIGTQSPVEQFQIGNKWTFHDGGTKVIGMNFDQDGGAKRIETGFASGIRLSETGSLAFWISDKEDIGGSAIDWIYPLHIENNGNIGFGTLNTLDSKYHFYVPERVLGTDEFAFKISINTARGSLYPLCINGPDNTVGINIKGNPSDLFYEIFLNQLYVNGSIAFFVNDDYISIRPPEIKQAGDDNLARISTSANCDGIVFQASLANTLDIYVGDIYCSKVKVQDMTYFPDFVFDSDYELLSLDELDMYIKENHHLPCVPSAEEVGENGMDLGDMNKILLQKIEELTLYVIEINIQNNELKNRLDNLEE